MYMYMPHQTDKRHTSVMYLPEFTKNPLELVTAKHSRIATTALLLPLILTKLRPMIYSVDGQYTQVQCSVVAISQLSSVQLPYT